jgi:hypothetical protein
MVRRTVAGLSRPRPVRIALAVLVPRSETGEGNAVKVLVLGAGASKSAGYPPLAGELMTTIEQDVRESRNAQPARSLGQVEGNDATNALELRLLPKDRNPKMRARPSRAPSLREPPRRASRGTRFASGESSPVGYPNSDRVVRWARRSESGLRFSANAVTLSLSRLVACQDASAELNLLSAHASRCGPWRRRR